MAGWYITEDRTLVDWQEAVVAGRATRDIFHLRVMPAGHQQTTLWARAGTAVSSSAVDRAVAETSGGPLPTPPEPPPAPHRLPNLYVSPHDDSDLETALNNAPATATIVVVPVAE